MSDPIDLWAKAPANLITDPDVSATAKIVYLYVDLKAGKRGHWYGTQQEIAEAVGVTPRTVHTAITQLADRGYLSADRKGQVRGTNRYEVAARIGSRDPIWNQSDRKSPSTRSEARIRSEKTHPINHRSSPRSNKRRASRSKTIRPTTDWDQFMKDHVIKEESGTYETRTA